MVRGVSAVLDCWSIYLRRRGCSAPLVLVTRMLRQSRVREILGGFRSGVRRFLY